MVTQSWYRKSNQVECTVRLNLAVSRIQDLGTPRQQFVAPTRKIAQMTNFSKGPRCQILGKSTLDDSNCPGICSNSWTVMNRPRSFGARVKNFDTDINNRSKLLFFIRCFDWSSFQPQLVTYGGQTMERTHSAPNENWLVCFCTLRYVFLYT